MRPPGNKDFRTRYSTHYQVSMSMTPFETFRFKKPDRTAAARTSSAMLAMVESRSGNDGPDAGPEVATNNKIQR